MTCSSIASIEKRSNGTGTFVGPRRRQTALDAALLKKVPADLLQDLLVVRVGENAIHEKASDTELLRQAQEGDPSAFRVLIRRHDRYLYRVARSVLLNDQDAEDVVQETYVRAFNGLVGFRGDSSLQTWLTRIALNEARRRQRRHRRLLSLEIVHSAVNGQRDVQVHPSPMIAPDQDPERATAQQQIRIALERAIDVLPEAYRTVFVMRDVEGESTKETASILGIRPQTVRTRLHRARRLLRDVLGEHVRANLKGLFPFERPRCDQLVRRLLHQLGFSFTSTA